MLCEKGLFKGGLCFSVLLLTLLSGVAVLADGEWMLLGPWGGYVRYLDASRVNPEFMAAVYTDSLFLTFNGGTDWEKCSTYPAKNTSAIFCAPWGGSEIWIDSDEGIFHSSDAGSIWKELEYPEVDPDPGWQWTLAVDTGREGRIMVYWEYGCFISENRGEIWKTISLPETDVRVAFAPWCPECLVAHNYYQMWTSKDSGVHWSIIRESNSDYFREVKVKDAIWINQYWSIEKWDPVAEIWEIYPNPEESVKAFDVREGENPVIFAELDSGNIYRKCLPDTEWQKILNRNTNFETGFRVNHSDVIVWGDEGVYRSEDGGDCFQEINHGLSLVWIKDFQFDPFSPEVMVAISSYEMYRSEDRGITWTRLPGVKSNSSFNQIQPDTEVPDRWYLMNDQILVSEDGCGTWHPYSENLTQGICRRGVFLAPDHRQLILDHYERWDLDDIAASYTRGFVRGVDDSAWERIFYNSSDLTQIIVDSRDPNHWIGAAGYPDTTRSAILHTYNQTHWTSLVTFENVPESSDVGYLCQLPGNPGYCLASRPCSYPNCRFASYLSQGDMILVNLDTGDYTFREANDASEIILLEDTGSDYLMISNLLYRSGYRHLLGTPVGNSVNQSSPHYVKAMRLDPLDPSRLIVSNYAGSLSAFTLTNSPPPPPPSNVRLMTDSGTLEIFWELLAEAVGSKVYIGSAENKEEGSDILFDRTQKYTLKNYPNDTRIYVKVSCYDVQGRESDVTEEQSVVIGPNSPVLWLGGVVALPDRPGFAKVSAYVVDPQGQSDLDHVEFELAGFPIFSVPDNGQGEDFQAGDGFVSGSMPIPDGLAPGAYILTITAVDKSGYRSASLPGLTVKHWSGHE